MTHSGPAKRPREYGFPATMTVLAFVILFAFVMERVPGAFDGSGVLHPALAAASESKNPEPSPAKEAKDRNEIIVYVTSWCPACTMTTDYLKNKKIPFVVKDVEKNEQYMKEMVKKVGGYRGVPVLDINGRILLGFNPHVLDQLAR